MPKSSRTFRDTLLHLRPRSWPIVFAHYAGGAVIAFAHETAAAPATLGMSLLRAAFGGILWTVCLNGGTLALNSAFDTDEGEDIGYLMNPPPPPTSLPQFSAFLMTLGLVLSLLLGTPFFLAYLASYLLSLFYSVPPFRLKAVAGADLVINMIGYGALTFAAGALALGVGSQSTLRFTSGLGHSIGWLAVGFGFLFAAFYPMTQIYQINGDAARGDRTLAVRLGARKSLAGAIAFVVLCGICQGIAAYYLQLRIWAWVALLASSGAWIVFTIDWLRRSEGYPSQKGMYRALRLWAVSDIVVIATFALGTRSV